MPTLALLPQAGAKPEPEEGSPSCAATVEEPKKERTPRLDWAGLLRRTFALEPVIGQVKNGVLPRLSLRGLPKVRGEFSLACAVHNLKKLWKQGWELPALVAQPT